MTDLKCDMRGVRQLGEDTQPASSADVCRVSMLRCHSIHVANPSGQLKQRIMEEKKETEKEKENDKDNESTMEKWRRLVVFESKQGLCSFFLSQMRGSDIRFRSEL